MNIEDGQAFRNAWITGVKLYYPGDPKASYIAPWEDTPVWEQEAAAAVCGQVRELLAVSSGAAKNLTGEQKGRFVSLCWIAQIHKHFPDPKPSYVADWETQPEWQRQVNTHIFDATAAHAPSTTTH